MRKFIFILFTALGLPLCLTAQELPLDITADTLSADIGDKNAVFEGNVVAKRGDLTLESDTLRVQQGNADRIERIIASGNIKVTRGEETATGKEAVYTPTNQTLVVMGDVRLTQGQDVIEGQRLVYNLAKGTARMDSDTSNGQKPQRIKAVIGPQKNDSE